MEYILNETVVRLRDRGIFRKSEGHFALDATDPQTTAEYIGAGMKTYTERKGTKDKQVVEVERQAYGFKVWVLKYGLGIDFVVPSKDKMRVTEDARELCWQAEDQETLFKGERAGKEKVGKNGKVKREGQVSIRPRPISTY